MKRQILTDAMNEISDRHISQAFHRTRRFRRVGGLAAMLALVILVLSFTQPLALEARAVSEASDPRIASIPEFDDFDSREAYNIWQAAREHRELSTSEALVALSPFFTAASQEFLSGSQNTLWSPANASIGLSMLTELTAGNTQAQLLELLGSENTDALRSHISALWESVYYKNGLEVSTLANSLWLKNGLHYEQNALDALSYHYYASVYRGNLGSAAVNKSIGTWLNSNTGGLLKSAADSIQLPKDAVLALYSTLYVQSKWNDEFSASKNTTGTFHAPSGDRNATYMNKDLLQTNYYWGDTYGAVSLRLKNGCLMWFILPDEGLTTGDVLQNGQYMDMLLSDEWENRKYMKVNLSVPKFDVSQARDLKDGLQKLGVTDLFSLETADFSAITSDSPVFITAANQAVRVQVDEQGVKAAVYIEFPGAGAAMPPEEIIDFKLDRPFLFVLTRSQVPLVAGVVNEP